MIKLWHKMTSSSHKRKIKYPADKNSKGIQRIFFFSKVFLKMRLTRTGLKIFQRVFKRISIHDSPDLWCQFLLKNRKKNKTISINKIAFLVFLNTQFDHIRNLIKHMRKDEYVIITCLSNSERYEAISKMKIMLEEQEIPVIDVSEVIIKNYRYKMLVQCFFHSFAQFFISRNLLCYESAQFVLQAWCKPKYFDDLVSQHKVSYLLTHSPFLKQQFKTRFPDIKVIDCGYTRLDDCFCYQTNQLKSKKNNKKSIRIVYFPVHGYLIQYNHFIDMIIELSKDPNFDVTIKLHSDTPIEDPQLVSRLKSVGSLKLIMDQEKTGLDSSSLFQNADLIFGDYGGTFFTSSYIDTNFLLLINSEAPPLLESYNVGDLAYDKEAFMIDEKVSLATIKKIILSETFWNNQKTLRKKVRDKFFLPFNKVNGKASAQRLLELIR